MLHTLCFSLQQAARLLRSWVRFPQGAWIFVCCECRVLSGRGLCDQLVTRPEESYRLCCVVVCDLETSRIGAPYTYDISNLRVNPQDEVGSSISSSVVLCSFVLLVCIVVLILVFCLCPSSVSVVASFSGAVLFPLVCSVLPFFP